MTQSIFAPALVPGGQAVAAQSVVLGTVAVDFALPGSWRVTLYTGGNDASGPYSCILTPPAGFKPASGMSVAANVGAVISSAPAGLGTTTLTAYGVRGFLPPQGAGGSVVRAIDAALLAAIAAGANPSDLQLGLAVAGAWAAWSAAGKTSMVGGGGGSLIAPVAVVLG